MKIIWTDFASNTLAEIYKYYKEVAGENVARKIKTKIFSTTRQLDKHPHSGQIEKTLEKLRHPIPCFDNQTLLDLIA
jgi:plasmid stabilization system protein ParE